MKLGILFFFVLTVALIGSTAFAGHHCSSPGSNLTMTFTYEGGRDVATVGERDLTAPVVHIPEQEGVSGVRELARISCDQEVVFTPEVPSTLNCSSDGWKVSLQTGGLTAVMPMATLEKDGEEPITLSCAYQR